MHISIDNLKLVALSSLFLSVNGAALRRTAIKALQPHAADVSTAAGGFQILAKVSGQLNDAQKNFTQEYPSLVNGSDIYLSLLSPATVQNGERADQVNLHPGRSQLGAKPGAKIAASNNTTDGKIAGVIGTTTNLDKAATFQLQQNVSRADNSAIRKIKLAGTNQELKLLQGLEVVLVSDGSGNPNLAFDAKNRLSAYGPPTTGQGFGFVICFIRFAATSLATAQLFWGETANASNCFSVTLSASNSTIVTASSTPI